MVNYVFVEGGGSHNKALQTHCRRGFSEFFRKSGLEGRMPRIVACGGRQRAYEAFRHAVDGAILLVDSETAPLSGQPWEHAARHDGWERPPRALDSQLHFMVQSMEAWFYANAASTAAYFGAGFQESALSRRPDVESIPKSDLLDGLKRATRNCSKGEYSKSAHSFQLLARIQPDRVAAASPYARRLLETLGARHSPSGNLGPQAGPQY